MAGQKVWTFFSLDVFFITSKPQAKSGDEGGCQKFGEGGAASRKYDVVSVPISNLLRKLRIWNNAQLVSSYRD